MALRNQPYLPLMVDDFQSDEKLRECSAEATGIYIRLMCLLHKTETYGVLLLKQTDKQTSSRVEDFATKLAKHLPYPITVILSGLNELLENDVIQMAEDELSQKRMIKDNAISEIRSSAGGKGGKKTQKKNKEKFAKAKPQANSGIGNGVSTVLNTNESDSKKEAHPEFQQAWQNFVEFRKKIRKPMTDRAVELNKNTLRKLSGKDINLAIQILNQSIERGWTGLFELKVDTVYGKKGDSSEMEQQKYDQ